MNLHLGPPLQPGADPYMWLLLKTFYKGHNPRFT